MSFRDYPSVPSQVQIIGDATYVGPNMERNNVREALQQLAADGRELSDLVADGDSPFYSDQAAGEAATSTGDLFRYPDGDGNIVYAERTGGGSTIIAYAPTQAQIDGKVPFDVNGNVALGVATADNARMQIKTVDASGVVRGLAIDHHAGILAGVGSYGLDVRGYPGADTSAVIHHYSNNNGAMEGGTALQIDHIIDGTILALKNSANEAVVPGSKGTANFINMIGYNGPVLSQFSSIGSMMTWTHQNVLISPNAQWPMTIAGAGLVINTSSLGTRGLEVNLAATGVYGGVFEAKDYGLNVSVDTDSGYGIFLEKSSAGAGTVLQIKNAGSGASIVCSDGSLVPKFSVAPTGNVITQGVYFVGANQVVGAQQTSQANASNAATIAAPPTQADFNALVASVNALVSSHNVLLAKLRAHGLIAT